MPPHGQELVRSLFNYVIAYMQIKTPCARNIVQQPWFQYLGEVPQHETVQFTPPVSSDSASGWQLLKVGRAKLVEPPRLPEILFEWMDADWKTQQDPRPTPQRDLNLDGEVKVELFEDSPERVAAFAGWMPGFKSWSVADRSARAALKLFEKLYEVYGILQRENELWELAVGDGFLFHGPAQVDHPLLIHTLQLDFDPKTPVFTITTTLKSPEIYVALLTTLGLDGRHLNALQEELEGGDYSPLGAEETTAFLKGLIQRFGNGVFCESKAAAPTDSPALYRKSVLFLRRRDTGFGRALSVIAQAIDAGVQPSEAILKIVGAVGTGLNAVLTDGSHGESTSSDGRDGDVDAAVDTVERQTRDDRNVLFSKESNAEQFEIAHRLRNQKTVLVQGPPGTGKTHTIANLIGSLLAQGKTVLVTSQASKPLRVLREKIVPELQPLCVSVVSGDEAGRRQLEASVNGITARLGSDSAQRLESESIRLMAERYQLLNRIDKLRQDIFKAANTEYRTICIGDEEVAPSEAARFVRKGHATLDWIPGPLQPLTPLNLDVNEVTRLYGTNAELTDEDIAELRCELPLVADLPTPEDFRALVSESESLADIDNHPLLRFWRQSDQEELAIILKEIGLRVAAVSSVLTANSEPWAETCLLAGIRGEASRRVWQMLTAFAQEVRDFSVALETDAVLKRPQLTSDPLRDQQQILEEIISSLSAGGKLGRFTLLLKRDWNRLIEGWRIKGSSPATLEDFQSLKARCDLEELRVDLRERWKAISPVMASHELPQDQAEFVACQAIPGMNRALGWHNLEWRPLVEDLKRSGLDWVLLEVNQQATLSSDGELLTIKNLAAHVPELIRIRLLQLRNKELKRATERLHELSSHSHAIVVADLRRAAGTLDADLYEAAYARLANLAGLRPAFDCRLDLLAKLCEIAPAWAENIVQRSGVHGGSLIPGDVEPAWRWRQYSQELDARNATSVNALQLELDSCQKQLFNITAALIDRLAWKHQLARVTNRQDQRTALQGWVDTMRRVGAGTGVQATRFLAEARKLMNQCKSAVPVWIMPMSRVVDSFDPAKTSFDVVIIDEASQCDLGGLVALWMAKEVIVVGDHEQVSPDAVGQQVAQIAALQETYLQDIPNKHLYDGQLSLYDLARQCFGGTVCLHEHFRCAPEIIQFSNVLSYDRKIKPLRDTTSIRVKPPLVACCLEEGQRRGDHNDEEALTIASLIVAAIDQPEYESATFGVIAMVGNTQAPLIDKLLRQKLPAAVYDERKVMCGNPSHFQGDERNIVFLSLVDAPTAPGLLRTVASGARDMYKKRYNVAASRAQDQLWVIHSMDRQAHLSPNDLRRRLLDHVYDPASSMEAAGGQEQDVDSEFERLVLKDLKNKGYKVVTQWKVGSYRIDLVVEGVRERLAVECDGDRYHTVENLQADMERQAVLERLGWRFIRIRGSEFFRDPDCSLIPLYERLERMGIEPLSSTTPPQDTELSKRVIGEARRIRTEWEAEPDLIDEILGRTRLKQGTEFHIEDLGEEEVAIPGQTPLH
jgi:very-short-patch-repair endonuclease/DNA polymerase III delta prime subunit